MTGSRCGLVGDANNGFPVDHVAVIINGISRTREANLCEDCRSDIFEEWNRSIAVESYGSPALLHS